MTPRAETQKFSKSLNKIVKISIKLRVFSDLFERSHEEGRGWETVGWVAAARWGGQKWGRQ